jgi:hypothetical protein
MMGREHDPQTPNPPDRPGMCFALGSDTLDLALSLSLCPKEGESGFLQVPAVHLRVLGISRPLVACGGVDLGMRTSLVNRVHRSDEGREESISGRRSGFYGIVVIFF